LILNILHIHLFGIFLAGKKSKTMFSYRQGGGEPEKAKIDKGHRGGGILPQDSNATDIEPEEGK
jgi:hypothetical protein